MDNRENRRRQSLGEGSGSAGEAPLPASGLAMLFQEQVDQLTGNELRSRATWGEPRHGAGLTDGLEVARDSISKRLIAERDIAVIDAVTERMGRGDWTVREIRERLIFQVQEGVTTAMLDGEPLLTIYPPEFGVKEEGPSTYLTAKQKIWRAER